MTWGSALLEFIVMGAANTAIALAAGLLLPGSGERPPVGTFLFLVGLLTLIVVLFDRFTVIDRRRLRRRVTAWRCSISVSRPTL